MVGQLLLASVCAQTAGQAAQAISGGGRERGGLGWPLPKTKLPTVAEFKAKVTHTDTDK